jgi:hypothetical protein
MSRPHFMTFMHLSIVSLCLCLLNGCYTRKEVTIYNPRIGYGQHPYSEEDGYLDPLADDESVMSFPPGRQEEVLPPRHGIIWRPADTNPNQITSVFYDSTRGIKPMAYSWNDRDLTVMVVRGDQYGVLRLELERIDSLYVVYPDYNKTEGLSKLFVTLGFIGTVIVLSATVK